MPLAGQLFFKWIKQHLRIKAFFGTTDAVKTQIWIAISVYVLVAIVKKRLGVAASLYTILPASRFSRNTWINCLTICSTNSRFDADQLNFFS